MKPEERKRRIPRDDEHEEDDQDAGRRLAHVPMQK